MRELDKVLWGKGHYGKSFRRSKAQELRSEGFNVVFDSYTQVFEFEEDYAKIFIIKDVNYHVLRILLVIKVQMEVFGDTLEEAVEDKIIKEGIQSLSNEFNRSIAFHFNRTEERIEAVSGSLFLTKNIDLVKYAKALKNCVC